jgi:hypothetical protein
MNLEDTVSPGHRPGRARRSISGTRNICSIPSTEYFPFRALTPFFLFALFFFVLVACFLHCGQRLDGWQFGGSIRQLMFGTFNATADFFYKN